MALITCPECGKTDVSDQAPTCLNCGFPVAAHLQQMREQEEARLAEQEVERQKSRQFTVIVVVGIAIALFIGVSISNSQNLTPSTGKVLLEVNNQTVSATPGANAFSASGKLRIVYSCHSNSKSIANVQLTLVGINPSLTWTVWKKSITCPITHSDTIQVKAGTYDIGASMSGDATWSMNIIQE